MKSEKVMKGMNEGRKEDEKEIRIVRVMRSEMKE